ncbi:MAG: hypothetical protein PWP55_1311 [Clostridiales bacterium]|nr:hypothetical protein [Clostridiales bacterium]
MCTSQIAPVTKYLDTNTVLCYYKIRNGDVAQSGRAPQWHCGGREFESLRLHHSYRSNFAPIFLYSNGGLIY